MYWGNPDASVSFCENKYKNSEYIAEYYNTLTALSYVMVGFFYLNTKLKDIGLNIIVLGIGTGVLHATLRYYGQMLDEIAMLSLSFNIISYLKAYKENKQISKYFLLGIICIYIKFYHHFYIFFLMFSSMQLYIYKLYSNISIIKYNTCLKNIYVSIFLISSICWISDQVLCEYVKEYNLHALWHVGTSISIFIGLLPLV
jgi:dihydroceramidase